ncbi:MAG: helix-turn-helix transcriptional regulator [Clostridia bacterium]|nr:helix-turn-helix transcriptional regulator [Clostridia bacterium]
MIDITSLPCIRFAHEHSGGNYQNYFEEDHGKIEVTYVAQGQLNCHKDGKTYTAEKGDVLCFITDGGITLDAAEFHCHHTVCADVDWHETADPNGFYLPMLTRASQGTEEIIRMIDAFIYKSYRYEHTRGKNAADFLQILCRIDALNQREKEHRHPEGYFLTVQAKKYIHMNIHQPITQAEVAAYLKVTPQYLCSVFKKAEGISLIKYVHQVKLKSMQAIMEKENLRLYQAAELFGFSDANYVSYLYKKTFGRSITSKPNLSDTSEKQE